MKFYWMAKLVTSYTCGDLNGFGFYLVFLIIVRIYNCNQLGNKDVLNCLNSLKPHRIWLLLDLRDITVDLAQALAQGRVELVLDTTIIFICDFGGNQRPFITLVSNKVPWIAWREKSISYSSAVHKNLLFDM